MAVVLNNGMKEMLVPIDGAGRIVLPKNVREDLAVKSGDLFKVSIHGTSVTLTPSQRTAGFVRRGKALVFTTRGHESLSLETVNAVLEEGREELAVRNAGGIMRRKRGA
jgi:AbrB family looped-hinge helix DNA binding protein